MENEASLTANSPSNEDDPFVEKRHGGCLTLWLGYMVAFNLLAFMAVLQILDMLRPGALPPGVNRTPFLVGVVLEAMLRLTTLICLVGIWRWQRWAVYVLAGLLFTVPFVTVLLGGWVEIGYVEPFINLGLLLLVVNRKRQLFV